MICLAILGLGTSQDSPDPLVLQKVSCKSLARDSGGSERLTQGRPALAGEPEVGVQLQLLGGAMAQLIGCVRMALAPAPACMLRVLGSGHSEARRARAWTFRLRVTQCSWSRAKT